MDLGRPHPRFKVLWPDTGGLAMFAELAHFLVDIPDAALLRPSAEIDSTRDLAQLRAGLDALVAQGFWLRDGAPGDPTAYVTADFTAPSRALEKLGPEGQWSSLADPCEDAAIATLASQLELPASISAVVVDEWLDPRLDAVNKRFRESERPWLLVRLAGEHPTVGPLFNAAEGAACWSCLSFRMLWNQPVRNWYHRAHPGELAAIPALWPETAVLAGLRRFADAARRLVEERRADLLAEVAWAAPDVRAHPVIRRPQCPVCGDPALYGKHVETPVRLSPLSKVWDEDGGFRSLPPEETARALERIVSPLTGLVAGVACRSKPGPDVNQVFRAWFGKTTFKREKPRTEELFQTTMGKGITVAQSRVSAVAEALERIASGYQGDEPMVRARARDLPGRSFLPAALAPFSEAQLRAFESEPDPRRAPMYAMLRAGEDDELLWTPVWSLSRSERCFVPFTWCYSNTPYDDDRRCRFFHNGGAAGTGLEDAILQGFLELVERDAVAVWWYNRLRRPEVSLKDLPEPLAKQLAVTVGSHSDYWVLDVTHDFEVPVFVSVSRERATGKMCLGFGCHLDARLALRRALTELFQILEIRDRHSAPFDFDAIQPDPYLFPDAERAPVSLSTYAARSTSDIADDVRACVARAERLGLEVLALDYSRPDIPLRTVKVIMPGACHLFPYRAAARLYDVPVRIRALETPLSEGDLNPLELLI